MPAPAGGPSHGSPDLPPGCGRAPIHAGAARARAAPHLSRVRVSRLRAPSHKLPPEVVVGVLLLLVAATAAILLVLGLLRVAVTG
jgi:hypothetical protein